MQQPDRRADDEDAGEVSIRPAGDPSRARDGGGEEGGEEQRADEPGLRKEVDEEAVGYAGSSSLRRCWRYGTRKLSAPIPWIGCRRNSIRPTRQRS